MKKRIITWLLALLIVVSVVDTGALLNPPTIISPTVGATGISCKPTLRWSVVGTVSLYDLQVSTSNTFATLIVDKQVAGTSYTITTTLTASTIYYWRVRSNRLGDISSWATAHFTTGTCTDGGTALLAPNLVSPVNNTTWTQSLYPTFQWQSVTGASSYTVQVSRSSTDFTSTYLVKEATVYSTYYMIDAALTNCTSYYWRVRGMADSTAGAWSSVWKFTLQVSPSQPVLTSPVSGVLTIRRPTFTWEASTGATAYTIEIDGATYAATTTTFTPYSNLSTGSHTWRVRATSCGGGQASDWSASATFTINLDDVVLKDPPNGTTVTTQTPKFEWYPVDGATKYKLEVRKDTIDGAKLFEVEVSDTSFTPTAILNPGTYAWHVQSYRNGLWTGKWSSQPFTFTVQTGGALTAPLLQVPLNGTTVTFPLKLQWGSVTGAYSYTLEYSRNISLSDPTAVNLFGTDYTISSALQEGRWYWRVRANASGGGAGPWSTVWSFEVGLPVPQLLSPANGASLGTSSVTFDWSDVTGSQMGGELYDLDHYVLQYSTSSTFDATSTITVSESGTLPLRDSRYGPLNLGDSTYYWRVKAVYIKYTDGTLREGSWSTSYSFSITTGGVNIPTLVSPISGSVMRGSSVSLVWTAVESTSITGYVLVYMKGTATSPGNPSQWTTGSYTEIIIPGQTTSSYTISLQENTSDKPFYWWSIATVNSSGQKGTFPSALNFSIDNTAPNISVVELVQPVDTTLSTRIPTFTWRIPLENYQGVASWTLEYASDIQLQQNRKTVTGLTNLSTIISGSYASISYTIPSTQALTNGTWYWHLSAADAAGNQSAFTAVKSFVVNAGEELPVKVSLVSPPNGFTDAPTRPTFSWLQVTGASSYRLQVDNSSTFGSPEIDQDGIATTSYMAPSDLVAGKYYWRVTSNAPNAVWSDPWSFTISGEAVQQVVLTSPSSGAQDMPATPLFQWQSLEGATSYTLEVSTNTQFTSLVVEKAGLTTTSWGTASNWEENDPSSLEDGTYYWRVSSDVENSTSAIWNFTVKKPSEEGGKVAITVLVSNLNDDPVSGATVTMKQDGDTKGTGSTDASGTITISNLDSGTYELEVTASGYGTYTETINLSSNMNKNIILYRGAVIHGYVYYDNTTNPAANVAVRIYETETQYQAVSDVTDTSGYFAVDNLVENKVYYIVVENYEDQKKQGIIPADTPTTANALTVIIKTEGEIIGVVQDEDGSPLPGAKVTLRDSQDQFINSTSTNNIGSFTFKVTPGKYYVEVAMTGYEDYRGSVFTVEYKEIEDVGLITMISRTGTLVVTVEGGEGEPLDALVTVKDEAGNIITSLTVVGGTASAEVTVGVYTLEAEAEGYQPQVVTNVSIESGSTVNQQFVLTTLPGSVKVTLEDMEGMPIPDAEVFLDGESAGTTDETGTLEIYDVTPDVHTVSVQKEGFVDYTDTQTVYPGETLILEVALEEAGLPLTYLAIPVVIVAAAAGGFLFLRGRGTGEPKTKERGPGRGKEKTKIPTGVRREGLPKQSYRGR